MKKFTFLLTIISSMILSENLYSQDYHSLYQSATSGLFQSFVNMSNPTTAETWFVASDDDGKIIVMQMDFSYPNPQPQNIWAFSLTMPATPPTPAIGQIYLKDGFFDPEGNIFVYGFEEASNRGVYAKIFFTNNLPTTLIWAFINQSNTQITDACWADGYSGASTMNYGIIYGDAFGRVNGSIMGNFGFLGTRKSVLNLTSVSYDQSENKFVLSGNSGINEPRQFIGTIENNSLLGTPLSPLSMPAKHLSLGTSLNPYMLSEKTNKHVLSGYSNGIAYLVQDIRDTSVNYGDGLWITEVNYLTGAVNWSKIYKFPPIKVNVTNVAQNYVNLYVLGHHSGLDQNNNPFERRYIAQIDLSNPQNFIVKSMSDENWWGSSMPSTYYATEQMYLSSLNFNEATYNIYASGATNQGDAYLVEINDLMYDFCDIDHPITTPSFVCACYGPISEVGLTSAAGSAVRRPSTLTTYSIDNSLICGDIYMAKLKNEELKAKIDNKRLKNTANQQIEIKTKTAPNIKVYEKYFICNNFEGACSYKIFDIFGRKLQEGTAHNNIEIEIRHKTTGTYLIQATDNKGNVETQKIIIKQQ
jgi:hypothetical protein